MKMARIENDVLILSEEERENLRKNLLHPPMNSERNEYLRRIEKLIYTETENGFAVCFDEVNIC